MFLLSEENVLKQSSTPYSFAIQNDLLEFELLISRLKVDTQSQVRVTYSLLSLLNHFHVLQF